MYYHNREIVNYLILSNKINNKLLYEIINIILRIKNKLNLNKII